MKQIVLLFSTALLFTQCHTAKMALPGEGWQTKQEYAVSGKRGLFTKERMSFGDYHTTSVKRSWTKGNNRSIFKLAEGNVTDHDYTNIISLEHIRKKQTLRFNMTDAANNVSEVYCVSKFNANELNIGNNEGSAVNTGLGILMDVLDKPTSTFYVQLYTKENQRPWQLMLDNVLTQKDPRSYTGYLTLDKQNYYTIHPVYQMEGKDGKAANILFGSIGFELRNKEGRPVAAVSMLDKGVIYLQPLPAEERFLLANACAALLMQDMIG